MEERFSWTFGQKFRNQQEQGASKYIAVQNREYKMLFYVTLLTCFHTLRMLGGVRVPVKCA